MKLENKSRKKRGNFENNLPHNFFVKLNLCGMTFFRLKLLDFETEYFVKLN